MGNGTGRKTENRVEAGDGLLMLYKTGEIWKGILVLNRKTGYNEKTDRRECGANRSPVGQRAQPLEGPVAELEHKEGEIV